MIVTKPTENSKDHERMATKPAENHANFGLTEWRKPSYDDTYEDAQLLHQCMTKRLKREDDPDYYEPDSHVGGDSPKPNSGGGQYFQKPIFQCPECVRSYKSPVRMANHYRDKHPDKDLRSPYARFPNSHSDKRHYGHHTSPPISPEDVGQRLPPYATYDYAHKHTRHERERERLVANENTSQLIASSMFTPRNAPPHHLPPPATPRVYSPSSYTTPATPPNSSSVTRTPESDHSTTPSPTSSPIPSPPSNTTHTTSSNNNHHSGKSTYHAKSKENDTKIITAYGRNYECKGIRISTVVDEIKFVECLEKNKQRLHLASIAYSQGLISSEEYSRKQREFLCAFSFF